MDDIKSLLGKRIRDLRKQKGLSQEELGWKSELHFTYIGAIERGEKNCSIATLEKLSKGLEISIKELFNISFHEPDINKLKKEIKDKINALPLQSLLTLKEMIKLIDMSK